MPWQAWMIGQGSPTLRFFFTLASAVAHWSQGARTHLDNENESKVGGYCFYWGVAGDGVWSPRIEPDMTAVGLRGCSGGWIRSANFKPLWMQISALHLSTWRMVARSAVGCLAISNQWSISKPAGFCNFPSSGYFHEKWESFSISLQLSSYGCN